MRSPAATTKAGSWVVAIIWTIIAVVKKGLRSARGLVVSVVMSSSLGLVGREENRAQERKNDDEKDCPEGYVEEGIAERAL